MIMHFRDVVKRYGQNLVLDHVNFDIQKGEIIGLLGPNGAGKTTTIKALMGLISVDGGEISLFDENLKGNQGSIKRRIGMVPQEIVIFNDLTTRENLDFFGRLYGMKGKELNKRVEEVMTFIGLKEYEKVLPKKFSGGMKRRLNIGCAIVHNPELLIMDEPTVGIDPQSRNHILESVRKLGESGTTVIYTTHYMEEVQNLCSRILIMDTGHIIADGSVGELIHKLNFEEKTHLEVKNFQTDLIQDLKNIEGVKDVSNKGKIITLLSQSGVNNLEEVIRVAEAYGIRSIQSETPTLEEYFSSRLQGKPFGIRRHPRERLFYFHCQLHQKVSEGHHTVYYAGCRPNYYGCDFSFGHAGQFQLFRENYTCKDHYRKPRRRTGCKKFCYIFEWQQP